MNGQTVHDAILALLRGDGCAFERIEHVAVSTAEEAATVRGTPLAQGAKSMVLKVERDFGLFVLPATRQLRSAKIRRALRVSRTRFATAEELHELTGLVPGSVPPFGSPVLPLPLYADPTVLDGGEVVFTAGLRTVSIRMGGDDYRRLASPKTIDIVR